MRVVPTFDPFEHGHLRFRLTFETPTIQQLTFERGKEALRHRIISSQQLQIVPTMER